ncbi:PIN domain-containing protein [Cellulomonas sp. S1-8]|uniref:PIN domain-containing protein n=1 Tax=Cellulomonas sp. S1-8 TaxID=2904790 RepID=UPI0022435E84|nr:PIN domain-containing protein [Cellulomonas sp. S1-8]UZN03570.1 PIN domain-containing protein [Cellulomonas sp. S1-8]
MGRRLILDTTTLIAYVRGRFDTTQLDDDDLAIAAITVAEFRTGIELADTPARAAERARVLTVITDTLTVLDYTERTAAEHARLLAAVRRTGTPRGAHDLIIAAHAAQDDRAVLSLDARARFADLPGVRSDTPR